MLPPCGTATPVVALQVHVYSRLKQHVGERVEDPLDFIVKGGEPRWQQFAPRLAQHLGLRDEAQLLFPGYSLSVGRYLVNPASKGGLGFEDRPFSTGEPGLLQGWRRLSPVGKACVRRLGVLCLLALVSGDPSFCRGLCRRDLQPCGEVCPGAGDIPRPECSRLPARQHAAPGELGGA